MMHGLTGTGKSTVAQLLGRTFPNTVVFHSAIIRLSLGLAPDDLSQSGAGYEFSLDDPIFTDTVSRVVYQKIVDEARMAIADGKNVILDGSFSMSWQRELVYALARELEVDFCILHCTCLDEDEIRSRIAMREGQTDPFSEAANWNTYLSLRDKSDPLTGDFEDIDFPLWVVNYDTYSRTVEIQAIGELQEAQILSGLLESLRNTLITDDSLR